MRLPRPLLILALAAAGLLWLRQLRAAVALPPGEGDGSPFLPWPPMTTPAPQPEPPAPVNAPRGIRNHNPGNIRRNANITWQGQSTVQADPAFVQFTAPLWGLRAVAKLLLNYQANHRLASVRDLITRYAPGHENPTDAYVSNVAAALGVNPDDAIDLRARPAMLEQALRAIVIQENGRPYATYYAPELYQQAARLAL
ncbi:MAG TPA: hypothetical protein VEC14_01195 [Reyranellaceae bacterium]|nr:hypothetical protein [Reyranellaceae bacterium]